MREYIISVITVSLTAAVITSLSPDEKRSGKYIKYLSGLVVLAVTIMPLLSASFDFKLPELPEEYTYNEDEAAKNYRDKIINQTIEIVKNDIKTVLYTDFHVHGDYVSVEITADRENYSDLRFNKIIITLYSYGSWADAASIEEYFKEKYLCEVNVVYE